MALDNTRWGNAVAGAIQGLGITAGTPISVSTLQLVWRTIKQEDKTEINSNADIALLLGDIKTAGNSGLISNTVGQPVNGIGNNTATTLVGKIK